MVGFWVLLVFGLDSFSGKTSAPMSTGGLAGVAYVGTPHHHNGNRLKGVLGINTVSSGRMSILGA